MSGIRTKPDSVPVAFRGVGAGARGAMRAAMRWAVAGVMAVAVACADTAPATCVDEVGARASDAVPAAYVGFRWACAHAPPCADVIACADPGWRRLPAAGLDAVAACLLGPCERRRECLDEVLAACWTQ